MFPNLRLLIAAAMASIIVLIFACGMFAAVRVSREPLAAIVPVVAAPLPALTEGDGARPLAFAPAEPFNRRFQSGGPQQATDAMAALTQALTRARLDRLDNEGPPGAAPPYSSATESAEVAAPAGAAPASDIAPAPAAVSPATGSAPEASESPPQASLSGHPTIAAEPAASEPPAILAAVEQPAEQLQPSHEIAPPSAAKPEEHETKRKKKAEKAAEPKPRHAHAARRRVRPANPEASFQQPTFVTAPAWQQPPTRTRRASVASRQAKDAGSGVGGPFMSAPGQ